MVSTAIDSVDRGQMAAFFVRAFDLADACSAGFADTSGSYFESCINALAATEIAVGCDAGPPPRYCPNTKVTRAQMSVFIHRALRPQRLSSGSPRAAIESVSPLVSDGPFEVTIRFDEPGTELSRVAVFEHRQRGLHPRRLLRRAGHGLHGARTRSSQRPGDRASAETARSPKRRSGRTPLAPS